MTLTDIAKRLNKDHGHLPSVFFITDQQAVPSPDKIIKGLSRGSAVILRDYNHRNREKLGAELRKICQEKGIIFLVAGDADLAVELSADGVHLPEGLMEQAVDIRNLQPQWIITASCHDHAAVVRAASLPINAGLIAPVFPTYSHPSTYSGQRPTLGLSGVRDLVAATTLPLYALGGITDKNARQLIGSGVVGIAAIRGFA